MGIDLRLAVKTSKRRTEEELRMLNYRFMNASSYGYGKNPIQESRHSTDPSTFMYEVQSVSRLYSKGYERGNFPEINGAVSWLRFNFPEGRIIYVGDHSDIEEGDEMTVQDQQDLLEWWCQHGRIPYMERKPERPEYAFECPNCRVQMSQCGWGMNGNYALIHCIGCGYEQKTEDGGKSWILILNK